jgi:hypothetical protein
MLIHDPAQTCGIDLHRLSCHVNRSHEWQEVTRRVCGDTAGLMLRQRLACSLSQVTCLNGCV